MYEIGRICVKLAGRDSGGEAVIVDILDDKYVLIDGNVRRRKCNIMHLEPSERKIAIKKGATHQTVKAAFEKIGLPVWETKPRKAGERPRKVRKKKVKVEEEGKKKGKKGEEKKEGAGKKGKTEKKGKKEKVVKEAEIVEEKKGKKEEKQRTLTEGKKDKQKKAPTKKEVEKPKPTKKSKK